MRYGDLQAELERIQDVMDQYRVQALKQENIAVMNHTVELAETAANGTNLYDTENCNAILPTNEHGRVMSVDTSHVATDDSKVDIVEDGHTSSSKTDEDVDAKLQIKGK